MLRTTQIAAFETLENRTFFSAVHGAAALIAQPVNAGGLEVSAAKAHAAKPAPKAAARKTPAPKKIVAPKKVVVPAKKATAPVKKTVAPVAPAAAPAAAPVVQDPALTDANLHYQNFSASPLFGANGPSENDIKQGAVGDCWLLSTLSSVAKTDPAAIRRDIVALGDGTYNVLINKSTVHIDADLPVTANGNLAYAALGNGGSVWVALFEKAFAVVRNGSDTYASLNSGWMDEAYTALGDASTTVTGSTAASLSTNVAAALTAGKSVTIGFGNVTDGSGLVSNHAYTVDSVNANGTITLRNPWGIGGAGNDGYVTVTAQQAAQSALGFATANV